MSNIFCRIIYIIQQYTITIYLTLNAIIFNVYVQNPSTSNDSYALIALGNIWLQTLYKQTRNKQYDERNQELALQFFTKVLKNDDKNIWASNGIG